MSASLRRSTRLSLRRPDGSAGGSRGGAYRLARWLGLRPTAPTAATSLACRAACRRCGHWPSFPAGRRRRRRHALCGSRCPSRKGGQLDHEGRSANRGRFRLQGPSAKPGQIPPQRRSHQPPQAWEASPPAPATSAATGRSAQRQAFPSAPLGDGQAALLDPPHPLRPQPPLLPIHRPRHLSPRLRELRMLPSRTHATNLREEWWRCTVTFNYIQDNLRPASLRSKIAWVATNAGRPAECPRVAAPPRLRTAVPSRWAIRATVPWSPGALPWARPPRVARQSGAAQAATAHAAPPAGAAVTRGSDRAAGR
jgi:hypothetical protein